MTTYDATDLNGRVAHSNGPYGNMVVHKGGVVTAILANADIFRLVRIPAGTRVDEVVIQHDQVDSNGAPTLTGKVGYTPVSTADGPAASDAYWFASAAIARTKAAVTCAAQPITFDYDVWLIFTATANPATLVVAANLTAVVKGESVGTK